jgi:peptidoglycan-associated lipoprotein
VRNYLIALGIPAERIAVVSFGKERPECAEAAEPCWAQNRRGVTVVNR